MIMAVVFNVLGAMGGTAVAATVGKGIVEPSAMTLPAITAAMLSIIAWGAIAARLGIPVSKSHALLAGSRARGSQVADGLRCNGAAGRRSALDWSVSLVLGFCGALLIGRLIVALAGSARPVPARSAPSTGCNCFPRPSWPSTTASTTGRNSWASSP